MDHVSDTKLRLEEKRRNKKISYTGYTDQLQAQPVISITYTTTEDLVLTAMLIHNTFFLDLWILVKDDCIQN